MCVRLKKSPFLAMNTHKTVKQGPAKENKFNTVVCKSVNQISGQRNHSLTTFFFTERAGPYSQELNGAGRTMGWMADWTRKSTIRPKSRIGLKQISKKKNTVSENEYTPSAWREARDWRYFQLPDKEMHQLKMRTRSLLILPQLEEKPGIDEMVGCSLWHENPRQRCCSRPKWHRISVERMKVSPAEYLPQKVTWDT
jgi:hypothetical protein